MEILSDRGLNELKFSIIRRACEDYETSLRYLRKHPQQKGWQSRKTLQAKRMKDECETFFRSQYFSLLCDLEGEEIMRMIRKKFYNRPIRWGEERKKERSNKSAKNKFLQGFKKRKKRSANESCQRND